jgi:hypothetical protein
VSGFAGGIVHLESVSFSILLNNEDILGFPMPINKRYEQVPSQSKRHDF